VSLVGNDVKKTKNVCGARLCGKMEVVCRGYLESGRYLSVHHRRKVVRFDLARLALDWLDEW
jgi:hypothetical protein